MITPQNRQFSSQSRQYGDGVVWSYLKKNVSKALLFIFIWYTKQVITCKVPVRRLSRPRRSMHFGDISSDHVTTNAYAARNNEAWGLGKVTTIDVVMIQDTKLQPLMTNATTSCCKPICSVSLGETSMASGRFTICWPGNWLVFWVTSHLFRRQRRNLIDSASPEVRGQSGDSSGVTLMTTRKRSTV